MKKILKKIITSTLTLMLTVVAVNSSVIEADAASKTYSGLVYVSTTMPSSSSGEITLSQGKVSAKSGWLAPTKSKTMTLGGKAKSGEYAFIDVKAETSDGTFYTTFKVKASHLGKKKTYKIKYKTKGIGVFKKITGITVSTPLF